MPQGRSDRPTPHGFVKELPMPCKIVLSTIKRQTVSGKTIAAFKDRVSSGWLQLTPYSRF
ncbi:hypothetical protein IQ268_17960 [Oculatella sp. LEGE 06141]|uniref:hypothetical protein n=1 Tax=Oculatella sp. LEGE 06141 TaxID=1828648 RepID=UPI001880E865|nr:hypothetical protein [Oculatella sp. LEGE 06141]MBE9180449.1 hypothetical protein [Oculatella sp. LEGE 06141]